MPRRFYSPDEKAEVLETLNLFEGDIAATSYKTGIPHRTLYTWRTEQWDQQRQQRQSQPPPPLIELPKYEDITECFEDIRLTMMEVVMRIPRDLSQLPPYLQRDRHLARLGALDIIIKLTEFLGVPEPEYDEIEYVHEYVTEEPKPEPKITHTYIHVPPPVYVSDDALDDLTPYPA